MSPSNDSDVTEDPDVLVCSECGARAKPAWSFCRSCQSSLADAQPPELAESDIDMAEAPDLEATGCPKCGHENAQVDEIATTGTGFSRLFDVQNRRFSVVTCQNCGYTEFYRGPDADVILDLFFG